MADLMTDLAQVVTDANRMAFVNSDPMRYSKRKARDAALSILQHACAEASSILQLAHDVENDVQDMLKDMAAKGEPPC